MLAKVVIALCLLVVSSNAALTCTHANDAGNGLNSWCNNNCNHIPPNCPSECSCSEDTAAFPEGCSVLSPYDPAYYNTWCVDNCFHNPSFCPSGICRCAATIPTRNFFVQAFFLNGAQAASGSSSFTGHCFAWATANKANLVVRCNHDVTTLTAAHVHRGQFGVAGPVIHTFPTVSGDMNLFETALSTDIYDMHSGNLYVNIHTANNPSGEIRGQISRVTTESTNYNFFLTQNAVVSNKEAEDKAHLTYTGTCGASMRAGASSGTHDFIIACLHNLDTVTAIAVRNGAEGSNGADVFTITPNGATFFTASATLDDTQAAAVAAGNMYIQIDSTDIPVRGQIADSTAFQYHEDP